MASDGNKLQEDLNHLVMWSKKWQLLFNQEKCKVMHYGRNNPQFDYSMNDVSMHVPAVVSYF